MSIRIVTDSTCDLPPEVIEKYQIKVVPLYINIGKNEYLDGIDITRAEFYRKLPLFSETPTTAVPSPLKFKAVYDALAEEGAQVVLSIHISEALSAMVNVAKTAARETISTAVQVIDARQLSLGTGFAVETAARMASLGHPLKEILDALEEQIRHTRVFAALDTLEFLKRSGRMNRWMSNLGSLLQIKPILTMHDGKPENEKVRTHERAMNRLVDMLESFKQLERVALVHTNAGEKIEELKRKAAHLLPHGEIWSVDITPVIGVHIGPGAVGFAAVGKQ